MPDISDGICAYLTGGLGNQLFVLAAAWEQANRLDCPLYIDVSKFIEGDLRNFELSTLDLPGSVIGEESPWKTSKSKFDRFRKKSKLAVYRENSFSYDPYINSVRPGTTLFGYFQSPKYFISVADRMRSMILQNPEPVEATSILRALEVAPAVTMHVRRGDFTDPATMSFHGLATPNYFERSLKTFNKLSRIERVRVFSDNPELAKSELDHLPRIEFFEESTALDGISTIKAMSRGSGMIMSNSSFSWWAAWLMAEKEDSVVIAPRPWLAAGEAAADLLLPGWLTLDAR